MNFLVIVVKPLSYFWTILLFHSRLHFSFICVISCMGTRHQVSWLYQESLARFSSSILTFIFCTCICRFQLLLINLECKILELMLVILMMMKAVVWLVSTLGMRLVFAFPFHILTLQRLCFILKSLWS